MNLQKISHLLVEFSERNKDKWNELDGAQGDGDLGITIDLSARALAETSETCSSVKEWFMSGGKAIRIAAPSTMGILIASALIAASKSIDEGKGNLTLEDWVSIQQSMANEIQKRGGAQLGDKTVLDAFIPAIQAFNEEVENGHNLKQILSEATAAAKKSAEETADLVSKIGRSSWIGERARGNMDGGAWVCYQIYEFLSEIQ